MRDAARVVKTGRRASALAELLMEAWLAVTAPPPAPKIDGLGALERERVDQLVGLLSASDVPRRTGGWDLALSDGRLLELDEELHFNRYRRSTLDLPWADALPWRDVYLDYCDRHEPRCSSAGGWGGRWTNPSCERLFGPASPPGDFTGVGAPRWKQRALYDAIKDVVSLGGSTRLVRLSVHDQLGSSTLEDVLDGRQTPNLAALFELVEHRST